MAGFYGVSLLSSRKPSYELRDFMFEELHLLDEIRIRFSEDCHIDAWAAAVDKLTETSGTPEKV